MPTLVAQYILSNETLNPILTLMLAPNLCMPDTTEPILLDITMDMLVLELIMEDTGEDTEDITEDIIGVKR